MEADAGAVSTVDPPSNPMLAPETATPMPSWRWPEDQTLPFREVVTDHARAEVDRIKAEALAAGWTEAQLYQNQARWRFPSSREYGLVCFVRPGRRIERVEASAIVLRSNTGTVLRFYRPAAPAPKPALR